MERTSPDYPSPTRTGLLMALSNLTRVCWGKITKEKRSPRDGDNHFLRGRFFPRRCHVVSRDSSTGRCPYFGNCLMQYFVQYIIPVEFVCTSVCVHLEWPPWSRECLVNVFYHNPMTVDKNQAEERKRWRYLKKGKKSGSWSFPGNNRSNLTTYKFPKAQFLRTKHFAPQLVLLLNGVVYTVIILLYYMLIFLCSSSHFHCIDFANCCFSLSPKVRRTKWWSTQWLLRWFVPLCCVKVDFDLL